ncbi:MAG TPA: serine hydrolase domain-containing protein [Longimicrobiales bacterium]|nr:serine hydrolase domain-containing protein [Longimicrobiales bacterium]
MKRLIGLFAFIVIGATQLAAQQLTPAERAAIDSSARAILAATGAPGAGIAIVRGGEVVYEQGYGIGRGEVAASPSMRYEIGSVSKQFTAAAILLLAEEGKLSLDDKVAKWFPQLTRASEISIRQLLSMTSGYQDYWPQDYVMPEMQRPTNSDYIMQKWAGKALDFDPGTKWQYSNTNYVIAGQIVERVSGVKFFDFLRTRIFTPLKMTSVFDIDAGPLGASDAGPYLRNAIGPLRFAPKEGRGWLFGAGGLAMTAHDLSLWNISIINRSLLKPASYDAQQTNVGLSNGSPTGYGLGVSISKPGGRTRISHGGAVSGYTTTNEVYPDQRAAIVVFTNIYPGAAGASSQIANRIANVLFVPTDTTGTGARVLARRIYDDLLKGAVDRSLFTDNANAYFNAEAIADYQKSLSALGAPTEFTSTGSTLRGGMVLRFYRIRAGGIVMDLTTMTMPDGKIEQYIVSRAG